MKTILGYHDKKKEHYGIIENKLPLLSDERYEPFLMTMKEFFTVQTPEISEKIQRYPIQNRLHSFKNTLATILLIPGIITAFLYIFDFITALLQSESLTSFVPGWITNLTFWLAVWGAMILWNETYKTIRLKERITKSVPFSEFDRKAIEQGDLGLAKRSVKNALDILEHETEVYIFGSVEDGKLNSFTLFQKLCKDPNIEIILDRLNIKDQFNLPEKPIVKGTELPSYEIPAIRSLLVYAIEEAVLSDSPTVGPEHLFISYFKLFPILTQYLREQRLNIELMRYVATWMQMKESAKKQTQTFNPNIPYYRNGGIAASWIYGYTFVLGHYSKDLTKEMAKKGGHYGIGHDVEMEEVLTTLGKVTKNNVLLIGESGTGKTSIAKGIAERINQGTTPAQMRDMRIIQLDVNGLIAAAPQYGNLESLIQQTMEELQMAGNTILFIDEIQEIVSVIGEKSEHSLAGILLPYVLESKFPIIGTITYADYKKYFYSRESLRQSFQTIEVEEVTPQAAFEIILTQLDMLEDTYDIKITFPGILAAVELAQRYVYDRKLPDSAVSIIELTCTRLHDSNQRVLLPADVSKTVATQTEIPVEDVTAEEATKLLNLEEKIKTKVIGQDVAVHQVIEALKRARTGVRDRKKPIGTFLFLGPTGVGKTYLSNTVGEEYFGEKHKMIRLDMSEFKDLSSVSRLLGSDETTKHEAETVTFLDKVKANPFSVILLDELEKAHPQILDLFLQVLDEGRMTNSKGETINFNNTIIIATSNVGSKTLLEALEKDKSMFEEAKERVLLELRQVVRVEFLNRFDQIIVFSPHSTENLTKIAVLLLKELRSRLLEKEITLQWDESLPKVIAIQSYQPGLGARPMRRYIQENVEGIVADKLLKGEIKPGGVFTATGDMLKM